MYVRTQALKSGCCKCTWTSSVWNVEYRLCTSKYVQDTSLYGQTQGKVPNKSLKVWMNIWCKIRAFGKLREHQMMYAPKKVLRDDMDVKLMFVKRINTRGWLKIVIGLGVHVKKCCFKLIAKVTKKGACLCTIIFLLNAF